MSVIYGYLEAPGTCYLCKKDRVQVVDVAKTTDDLNNGDFIRVCTECTDKLLKVCLWARGTLRYENKVPGQA